MQPPPETDAPPAAPAGADTGARARHWRAAVRLSIVLLVAWAAVGFGIAWYARALDFDFFGWPFSFWVAAQGGPIAFALLTAVYAWRMAGADRRKVSESAEESTPPRDERRAAPSRPAVPPGDGATYSSREGLH